MELYKIKTKKQENGLWGMPLMVKYYNCSFKNEKLRNAIVISLTEKHEKEYDCMKVSDFGNGIFVVLCNNHEVRKMYSQFDQYYIEGNDLIYFNMSEEKKKYIREKKLLRITT